MLLSGLVYTMCYYAQRNINVDLSKIEILQVPTEKRALIEWTANQLTFLSIFNSLEIGLSDRATICKRIVDTWGINNPELADQLETRLHYIYITLVQKPGLIWLENLLVNDGPTERLALFQTFIVSDIESMLEEFPDLRERYINLNSSNGTNNFTLPTALLSSTNFESQVDELLSSVGQGISQLASSEQPPQSPAAATQFGKLAKVFKPYREFVFDVKTTGAKRGIYVKTRFGIKKVKDDKYGLYVTADGKKFHLYKWGRP